MITSLLNRILTAGPGPALFGLGITILAFLVAARRLGYLNTIRRKPLTAIAMFTVFYALVMVGASKPPKPDPDPEPEPFEVFTAHVWIGDDDKIILINTPLKEVTP